MDYECRLDAAAWSPCTSPATYQLALQSATGGIRFRTRSGGPCSSRGISPGTNTMPHGWPATDVAVWSTCPASIYVNGGTADTTEPDTTISVSPSASTTATIAAFSFGGTDDYAVTAYECQLDGGSWTACASPRGYAALVTGAHTFAVRAIDAAGNVDGSPATASWTVTSGAGSPTLLAGNATVDSHADPIPVGIGKAWPVTASASGTAGAISVYVDSGSTAGELQAVLYANSATAPSTRLASGSIASPTPGAWNVVPLSGSVSIASGTAYWLGVMSTSPTLSVRDRSGGTCTARTLNTPLGAFPSTWTGALGTSATCPPSITLTTG